MATQNDTIKSLVQNTVTTKKFGDAAIAACHIAETFFKDYTKEYQPLEAKLENVGKKLKKHFHGIAKLAITLATGKDQKPDLQIAAAYFVELCKRAEAKLLKDHKQANGEQFKSIAELVSVWPKYRRQVADFFSGTGKMPEGKDASDNPADYDADSFVSEMTSRKGASRGANTEDGSFDLSDATKAGLEVLTKTASQMPGDWQDEYIVPVLTELNLMVSKAIAARSSASKVAAARTNGEVDAPARVAA